MEHGPLEAESVSRDEDISEVIRSLMREVPDFPEPGVQFKDLTPVLADAHGLAAVSKAISDSARGADLVAGVDARGFLLGGAVAVTLGIGVLAVRKGGKLPPPVLGETYTLEYGSATLEVPANGVELAGRSVVVIDDVLATGGTLAATHQLLTKAGAEVTGAVVMMELTALGGRAAVEPLEVTSLYTV
ncbi:adenine phosphoribosyltransferase [Mycolicibacterium sp. BiH015]|uniref:adenine phosphoribosyltransferase n=1 Tax=Mycolicibacterium sp. BiH015 TaxID=3018808 RepID=UPI0022DFEC6F|nr:adenine phosphoribosyltransferase [Mycolicibacterium sp. BiH015]MDA2891105.1 adenine phosphoribosyltransferase [Mycolicibacterium sp. BiH015]